MRAEQTTALVLAGGLGTRLREVVSDRPKVLAEVAGQPFLSHLLEHIARSGVRQVVLCTGHLGDQVEAEFGDRYGRLELSYSREQDPLGTGGAVAAAMPMVRTPHVVVLNGDSYCDADLGRYLGWCRGIEATAALLAIEVDDVSRYGRVDVDATHRLVGFAEKGATGPGTINAGVYYFCSDLARSLPRGPLSLECDVLPRLMAEGVFAQAVTGRFIDIGTPESLAAADGFFGGERAGLLILDRDGTLIREKHYLADPNHVELLPGVGMALRQLKKRGYSLAVVTNQSGVGRGYYDESTLDAIHDRMVELLGHEGVELDGIWHCPHAPDVGCRCRKPESGLLEDAVMQLGYAPAQCLVVGDKECDIELGRRAGARTVLVRTGYGRSTERRGRCQPDMVVDGLAELVDLAVTDHES